MLFLFETLLFTISKCIEVYAEESRTWVKLILGRIPDESFICMRLTADNPFMHSFKSPFCEIWMELRTHHLNIHTSFVQGKCKQI